MPQTPNQRSTRSNSSSNTQITLSDIKTLIQESKQQLMDKFENVISKQTEEIASLTKHIEQLKNSNVLLEQKYNSLEDRFTQLSTTVFDELEDRQRRRNNLMFSGVPEAASGTAEERKQADRGYIEGLMIDLSIFKERMLKDIHRVGKIVPGKPRLLKVKFHDENDRQNVLRKSKSLHNMPNRRQIFINPDYTVSQMHDRKRLFEELKQRRALGDDVVIFRGKVVLRSGIQNFHQMF